MKLPITLELPDLSENELETIRGLSVQKVHQVLVKQLGATDPTVIELSKFMLTGLAILAVKREQEA